MINWEKIDTVLLDMDGTLLDLYFDNYFWKEYVPLKYASKHSISLSQSKAELAPRFSQIHGRLQWYCLDYWNKELDLNIVEMKQELARLIKFLPHADTFLLSLKNSDKEVIMITNAHQDSLSLKLEKVPMAQYFDRMISSHDYGYPKESQAFWHSLQADINLNKDRALFIDDNIGILDAAKTFGIAQLLAVRYPDSQESPRDTGSYYAIEDYRDILITNECK
ncbi:MAG: GMP/IMP nucleotidase [Candidatus Endonucleobacter bathymodioli]|uniref:GMP/IMP nucleotidase n=1 Tax=Candidatus Endonucleibacter bathymodioli TaxID=539814 RepID=A0AA90NKV0_9GAMM|nr:GMP/IMP nucleotidase [Candidatus Endonucleobacter bathymodioli]